MLGGDGQDTYFVDNVYDTVTETYTPYWDNDPNPSDKVISTISWTLGNNLEDLQLSGSKQINGSGNELRNVIVGNEGNNELKGLNGNDKLYGKAGADQLYGGKGKDVMFGGSGADTFAFVNTSESKAKAKKADIIKDFQQDTDVIDLSAIDASTELGGNDAFSFNGTTAFSTDSKGEIRYKQFDKAGTKKDYTMVFIDIDSDRGAEMSIKLMGLHSLTADDFIL